MFPHIKNQYTSWITLFLLVVISLVLIVFLSGEVYLSDTTVQSCERERCLYLGDTHGIATPYPKPERYSQAWWTQYCNAVLNTDRECK